MCPKNFAIRNVSEFSLEYRQSRFKVGLNINKLNQTFQKSGRLKSTLLLLSTYCLLINFKKCRCNNFKAVSDKVRH